MPTLRKLSVIYLLCATWFSVAIAFDRDPPLARASRSAAGATLAAVERYAVRPGIRLAQDGANRMIAALNAPAPPARKTAIAREQATPTPPSPVRAARPQEPLIAINPKPVIRWLPSAAAPPSLPATSAVPPGDGLAPAELARVSARLRENITHEMLENFSLFLYVSKAEKGPWAQRLYVFRKDARENLALLYNWPASTGREKFEIAANGTHQHTITPAGYYELDPSRMYRSHFSGEWHEPMPYAMFFNWENHGYQTGLAIHGAAGPEVSQLGMRASAGCIRIAPENAQLLFGLIRAEYKGLAPRFAFDRRTATMSNDGMLMHDPAGNLERAEGFKVLVFVENYGGADIVAALY